MDHLHFIHDLAIVMIVAGLVTLLFHRLRQPVVLGYILAGVLIGPHIPLVPQITDESTINTLSQLGVVFLMFSLGLEFSLRKLAAVGATALIAAGSEIVLMMWLGYETGRHFGWSTMDALFLGSMLAISSTTIIAKTLRDLGKKREHFTELIFGILIVEDILAIALIALLSSIAMTGSVAVGQVVTTLGKLSLFVAVALMLGLLAVPRLLQYVASFKSSEMMLITVLGLCFGMCLLVIKLGYSVALGAFITGAVIAESRQHKHIEHLIAPLRDMFSAIFFVAIGLMLDPATLMRYATPVLWITATVIIGKIVSCSLGTLLSGHDGRTALRVGMGLAQIGEFSFIMATLGHNLGVTSDFLYPIAVAVSALTTLTTPYLIRAAEPSSDFVSRHMPRSVTALLGLYTTWAQNLRLAGDRALMISLIRRMLVQILLNLAIVAAIFLGGSYWKTHGGNIPLLPDRYDAIGTWCAALAASLPFLIAMYRKLQAMSLLLAEISLGGSPIGDVSPGARMVIAQVIPMAAIGGVGLWLAALSSAILPPLGVLVAVISVALCVALILWRQFVHLHSRLQIALIETFDRADAD